MSDKHHILWHGIHFALSDLISQLNQANFKPDIIIGVGRGGLIPATLLAYRLNVREIHNFSVRSYNDDNQRENIQVIQEPGERLKEYENKNILIVDDLSDSGNTLSVIQQQVVLKCTVDNNVKTATLFIKDKTNFIPDFYSLEYCHDTWLVFPWEGDEI